MFNQGLRMGKYDGYLQGLSLAAILVLAPIALALVRCDNENVLGDDD